MNQQEKMQKSFAALLDTDKEAALRESPQKAPVIITLGGLKLTTSKSMLRDDIIVPQLAARILTIFWFIVTLSAPHISHRIKLGSAT